MKNKMRLFALALLLTVPALSARASQPAPPLCDKYCSTDDVEVLCSCPEWTDQRVDISNCQDWDGYRGCWWF